MHELGLESLAHGEGNEHRVSQVSFHSSLNFKAWMRREKRKSHPPEREKIPGS